MVQDPVDEKASVASWYLDTQPAEAANKVLNGAPDGAFVVRRSGSDSRSFVLVFRYGMLTRNTHIHGTPHGLKLTKPQQYFPCLTDFVSHYGTRWTPEVGDLPCPLLLPPDFLHTNDALNDPKLAKKLAKERDKEEKKREKEAKERAKLVKINGAGGPPGSQWDVDDVCDWLCSMDLSEYDSGFRQNKIDGVALLTLTTDDLQAIGITVLGHRKKLGAAIDALNQKLRNIDAGQFGGPGAPPGGARPQPVSTIGLVARNVNGVVKIFDVKTNEEVTDIASHQRAREESIRIKKTKAPSAGGVVHGADDDDADASPPAVNRAARPSEFDTTYPPVGGSAAPPPPSRPPRASAVIDVPEASPAPLPPRPAGKPAPAPPSGPSSANAHLGAPWFQPTLDKAQIAGVIGTDVDGIFVVRESASEPGCFALSYSYGGAVLHKIIESAPAFKIRAAQSAYPSLSALIEAYVASSQGDIKCPLATSRAGRRPLPPPSTGGDPTEEALAKWTAQLAALPPGRRPQWNAMDLSRDEAMARVQGAPAGTFVIRASDKAFCAISLVKPDGSLFHQHIDALPAGLQVKKTTSVHADLFALVDFFSRPGTDLPCALRVR